MDFQGVRIGVFCSSCSAVPPQFAAAARRLGAALARAGYHLVYGGTYQGMMAELAGGARDQRGMVTGVVPRVFESLQDSAADRLVILDTLQERKRKMLDICHGFVALPGGIGTLDEILEVLCDNAIYRSQKPMFMVNIGGFYDPLIRWLDLLAEQGFVQADYFQSTGLQMVPDVAAVMTALNCLRSHE